jgi:nicotinamidase-related amidase
MTLIRTLILAGGLALMLGGHAQAQRETPKGAMQTMQVPALPAAVPVALAPATTGILLLDYVDPICKSQPKCTSEMLPAMAGLVARARKANVPIAYGTREQSMSRWLPEVAPMAGDIKIANTQQDRFYNTDLDKQFKAKGVTTVIMAGWKVSGSVAYTSVGATIRDFTVVIPMDATAAASDFETYFGFFQILNQGNGNPNNEPLKAKAPTLSRAEMVTFK